MIPRAAAWWRTVSTALTIPETEAPGNTCFISFTK